jgi:hypothetical protein
MVVIAGFVKVLKERLSRVNPKLLEEAKHDLALDGDEDVDELLHAKAMIVAAIKQRLWSWATLVERGAEKKVIFKNEGLVNDLRAAGFNVTHFRTLGKALEEVVEGCQYKRIREKAKGKAKREGAKKEKEKEEKERPWAIVCDLDSLTRLLF